MRVRGMGVWLLVVVATALPTPPVDSSDLIQSEAEQAQFEATPEVKTLRQEQERLKAGDITSRDYESKKTEVLASISTIEAALNLLKAGVITREDYDGKKKEQMAKQASTASESKVPVAALETVQTRIRGGSENVTCAVSNGGCHSNATCYEVLGNSELICACNTGFVGDGIRYCGLYNIPHILNASWTMHNPFAGFGMGEPDENVHDVVWALAHGEQTAAK